MCIAIVLCMYQHTMSSPAMMSYTNKRLGSIIVVTCVVVFFFYPIHITLIPMYVDGLMTVLIYNTLLQSPSMSTPSDI